MGEGQQKRQERWIEKRGNSEAGRGSGAEKGEPKGKTLPVPMPGGRMPGLRTDRKSDQVGHECSTFGQPEALH